MLSTSSYLFDLAVNFVMTRKQKRMLVPGKSELVGYASRWLQAAPVFTCCRSLFYFCARQMDLYAVVG